MLSHPLDRCTCGHIREVHTHGTGGRCAATHTVWGAQHPCECQRYEPTQ